MTEVVEVTTTLETAEQAQVLAKWLVGQQLAACVQITGPIQSVYRWQGEICESSEYRCTIKSTQSMLEDVKQGIQQQHPYDVPEILVQNVADCSDAYAEWLQAQVRTT